MPRKFGSVNVEIWNDPDWRNLPPAAQHLYMLLWTAPELSFCGVHDWRPARLTQLSNGFTTEHTQTVAQCLAARHFLVIDEDTEEVLIRSWARFDQLLKQPRLAVSYSHAYAAVYSAQLRQVIAHETQKMKVLWPDLPCWKDERVASLLTQPAISAKDLPVPEDPFGDGFGDSLALGLAQTQGKVWPPGYPPPTPAPTPTPITVTPERSPKSENGAAKTARKRASSAPENFEPNDNNRKVAAELGLDLGRVVVAFLEHHGSKGSTFVDWNLALNTWMRRERPVAPTPKPRVLRDARDIELPPDGLTPVEYAAWEADQRARRNA